MADKTFSKGDTVYFLESTRWLREAKVLRVDGDCCVIRFTDNGGGIRTRLNRLFATQEEAEAEIAAAEAARSALTPPKKENPPEPLHPLQHSQLYYLQLMT